jgi:hypothetical protein
MKNKLFPLSEYLFVYSHKEDSFPVCLRIVTGGAPSECEEDGVTGTITKDKVEKVQAELEQQYSSSCHSIVTDSGLLWAFVQKHYTKSLRKDVFETSVNTFTKMFFLFSSIFLLAVVPIMWPDFMSRYGSLTGVFYSIYYNLFSNPLSILPCLLFISAPVVGIWLLFQFIYYQRCRVWVDSLGIRLQPGNRKVTWHQVEHIVLSIINPPDVDMDHLEYSRVILTVRDERPINLPHRYRKMAQLIFLIRKHVEPILLDQFLEQFHKRGKLSFGDNVTMTRKGLKLHKEKQSIALNKISRITIKSGNLQVVDLNDRILFSEIVGLIPDAILIPELFQRLKSNQSLAPDVSG